MTCWCRHDEYFYVSQHQRGVSSSLFWLWKAQTDALVLRDGYEKGMDRPA